MKAIGSVNIPQEAFIQVLRPVSSCRIEDRTRLFEILVLTSTTTICQCSLARAANLALATDSSSFFAACRSLVSPSFKSDRISDPPPASFDVLHAAAHQGGQALPSRPQATDPLQGGHLARKGFGVLRDLLAKLKGALKSRKRDQIYAVRDEIERAVGRIAPPAEGRRLAGECGGLPGGHRHCGRGARLFSSTLQDSHGIDAAHAFRHCRHRQRQLLPAKPLARAIQLVWLGRNFIDVTAKEDEIIVELQEATYLNFFTFTTIVGEKNAIYGVCSPRHPLSRFRCAATQDLSERVKRLRAAISRPETRSLSTRCPITSLIRTEETFLSSRQTEFGESRSAFRPESNRSTTSSGLAGIPGDVLRIDAP